MDNDGRIAELEHKIAQQKLLIAKLSFELARRDGMEAENEVARTKAVLDEMQKPKNPVEDAHA
jgi:uncharacterized coiled-coil protein SlyX